MRNKLPVEMYDDEDDFEDGPLNYYGNHYYSKGYFGQSKKIPDPNGTASRFKEVINEKSEYFPISGFGKYPFVSKIFIVSEALETMRQYVKLCPYEIGWFGTVLVEKDIMVIDKVFLFEQEVSSTETDINSEAIAKFVEDLFENENIDNPADIVNRMRVWGHSHVDMGTTPSGQDNKTMEEMGENVKDTNLPFMVRIIATKNSELKIDIWYYDIGIRINNVNWEVYYPVKIDTDAITEEISKKVKMIKYTPPTAKNVVRVTEKGKSHIKTEKEFEEIWIEHFGEQEISLDA